MDRRFKGHFFADAGVLRTVVVGKRGVLVASGSKSQTSSKEGIYAPVLLGEFFSFRQKLAFAIGRNCLDGYASVDVPWPFSLPLYTVSGGTLRSKVSRAYGCSFHRKKRGTALRPASSGPFEALPPGG